MTAGSRRVFVFPGIRTTPDAVLSDVYGRLSKLLRQKGIRLSDAKYSVFRRSVDCRHRDAVSLIWSVAVTGNCTEKEALQLSAAGGRELLEADEKQVYGTEKLSSRPLIVGSGPAGLFCALSLAENGYCPHIIERGGSIRERVAAVARFMEMRVLDAECNVQFGAGGAGTFSDGKLMTRINDSHIAYILRTFVSFGAPEDILYQAKPHIGTDLLRTVIEKMTSRIIELGGSVSYHTKLLDISENSTSVLTSQGEIPCGALMLATGNSARDTYGVLLQRNFTVEPKPFSVGVRIEHLQNEIDRIMYGNFAGHPALGHAEYALSCHTKERGVYTFCMCPGGEVIASTSEHDAVVVNGMSFRARDGRNANAAVAVSVKCEDYGNTPQNAIRYQHRIEEAAFFAGGGDYSVPCITVGDFLSGKCETEPSTVTPTYMKGNAFRLVSPEAYLPENVTDSLRSALVCFDRSMNGFAAPGALLSGPETRTSAPVRILRAENGCAVGHDRVYPCGEGAGYAGGITSAATDGLRAAFALMKRFRPLL